MLIEYTPADEWQMLLDKLSSFCSTSDGKNAAKSIQPNLTQEQVEKMWSQTIPLKSLLETGYEVNIGELSPVAPILEAAIKQQLLTGEQLRSIFDLQETTHRIHKFTQDFAHRCQTFFDFAQEFESLSSLRKIIGKSVLENGTLTDEASPALKEIRQKKVSQQKRTEDKLRSLLQKDQYRPYVQDDFFTKRSDRYVIPMTLDGRGRIPGSIVDTSASGQTLFIEPGQIRADNEALQEFELTEKLEIIKIFRHLSQLVTENREAIAKNYDGLIRLDLLSARSKLAHELQATTVRIAKEPVIKLRSAHHPLIQLKTPGGSVSNHIELSKPQKAMIISGPNAGGKTIVLKTVGILQAMLKSGLLIPADPQSEMFLYEHTYFIMGDSQNIEEQLSTFSGHIKSISQVLSKARSHDLVLLDELASGTEPETGAAIAQAVLESLETAEVFTLSTTHFERLKTLAIENTSFRNASMQYDEKTGKPSYTLLHDVPGQSLGLETAAREGLPPHIIQRAEKLRGTKLTSLEMAFRDLATQKAQAIKNNQTLEKKILEANLAEEHWKKEKHALRQMKNSEAQKVGEIYEKKFLSIQEDLESELKKAKDANRENKRVSSEELLSIQTMSKKLREKFNRGLHELERSSTTKETTPGRKATHSELEIGLQVYIKKLAKKGTIASLPKTSSDTFEIDLGIMKVKVRLDQIRMLSTTKSLKEKNSQVEVKTKIQTKTKTRGFWAEPEPKTSENSIDLRGLQVEEALDRLWKFVDNATLRGNRTLFIEHGIGSSRLKTAIHEALSENTHYDIEFQSASRDQGGQGTTILTLR